MARVWLTEFASLARDFDGSPVQAGAAPALREQTLELGDTSKKFTNRTKFVMLYADELVMLDWGQGLAHPLPAGTRFYGVSASTTITVKEFVR
jgi:hypothetical protein